MANDAIGLYASALTDQQRRGLATAESRIQPALELYAERNRLAVVVYRLPLRDLRRLNDLIGNLGDEGLRQVARYAEALAEWADPAPSSGDAQKEAPGEAKEEPADAGHRG